MAGKGPARAGLQGKVTSISVSVGVGAADGEGLTDIAAGDVGAGTTGTDSGMSNQGKSVSDLCLLRASGVRRFSLPHPGYSLSRPPYLRKSHGTGSTPPATQES